MMCWLRKIKREREREREKRGKERRQHSQAVVTGASDRQLISQLIKHLDAAGGRLKFNSAIN